MSNPNINNGFKRLPDDLVKRAGLFQPAILADVAGRRGALSGRIRALHPGMRFAGSALTVEVRPGDNLIVHTGRKLTMF